MESAYLKENWGPKKGAQILGISGHPKEACLNDDKQICDTYVLSNDWMATYNKGGT